MDISCERRTNLCKMLASLYDCISVDCKPLRSCCARGEGDGLLLDRSSRGVYRMGHRGKAMKQGSARRLRQGVVGLGRPGRIRCCAPGRGQAQLEAGWLQQPARQPAPAHPDQRATGHGRARGGGYRAVGASLSQTSSTGVERGGAASASLIIRALFQSRH